MDEPLPCPSYKVVILGDSSVGKTSLVHRFTTDQFDTNISNTIGAAFITKQFTSLDHQKTIKFEIWDTAGQERYRSLTPMYYRNSKVALICYDLTNIDDSFIKAKYWIDQLNLNNESNDDAITILLVGTKHDLVPHANLSIVKDFQATHPAVKNYLTSAKSGDGIIDIFNDIIDNIPMVYFDEHYQSLKDEANHHKKSINFLNNQFTHNNASCC